MARGRRLFVWSVLLSLAAHLLLAVALLLVFLVRETLPLFAGGGVSSSIKSSKLAREAALLLVVGSGANG